MSLDHLPPELLLTVAAHLVSRGEVLFLSQVCSALYARVVPALYAVVDLHGAEQCERTLGMLQRCPAVARHVQRLAVHPESDRGPAAGQFRAWDNAGVVSRAVLKTAPGLDALQAFEWDGEDMLPDDRMWAELRLRCKNLKHLGTTFGCFLPRPTSSLFTFDDLHSFKLVLKEGFYANQLHVPSRESEPLAAKLWEMLVARCPNLESLSVGGHSAEALDGPRLFRARWPKLRKLTVGAVLTNDTSTAPVEGRASFTDFLEAHPGIESLNLVAAAHPRHADLSLLDPKALPGLKEFSGPFQILRTLVERDGHNFAINGGNPGQHDPNAPPPTTAAAQSLQHLDFAHAMQLRDMTPHSISRVLTSLHGLTSMKFAFAIQSGYDSNGVFRTIVASCPQLKHLDATFTCRASFFLDAFSAPIRSLTRLRTFSLSLVRMSGEESLQSGAARLALANPRLTGFSITFILPTPDPVPVERGAFELVCDEHGIPVQLKMREWRARSWCRRGLGGVLGSGLVGSVLEGVAKATGLDDARGLCVREMLALALGVHRGLGVVARGRGRVRYRVCELRASGHPDVPRKTLGQLLLAREPAGEEARLMAFCVGLLLLTAWAVVERTVR